MTLPASRGRQTSYFCLKAACSDEERLHSHQCDCKTGICTEGQINFCKLNNSRVTAGPLTEFLLPEDKRSLIGDTHAYMLWSSWRRSTWQSRSTTDTCKTTVFEHIGTSTQKDHAVSVDGTKHGGSFRSETWSPCWGVLERILFKGHQGATLT